VPCTPNCGACCDPALLTLSTIEMLLDPEKNPEPASKALVFDAWAARPYVEGQNVVWFDCFHYDVDKRECSIYEDRPPVCRIYPRTGGPEGAIEPDRLVCGYQADAGRTVLPIVAVT
jgi:Fe-S-cluster containining protein